MGVRVSVYDMSERQSFLSGVRVSVKIRTMFVNFPIFNLS